jgi:transmembrane sensor
MTQYEFDKLLDRYLQGACTPSEELLLDEWANRQMDNDIVVLSEEESKTVKKQLWKRIKQSSSSMYPLSIRWFSWAKLGMAASLIFMVSIGLLFYKGSFQSEKLFDTAQVEEQLGVEMTNTTDKPQDIHLTDGTIVNLQPNSTLTFSEKAGEHKRVVYLKGEGFFKVKRDTTKPFYVHAGNLVTEVLGTSFTVKSYENDKTAEVVVVSGKVKVYNVLRTEGGIKKDIQQTILTPNQKVVFEKVTQEIKPFVVEQPIALSPPKSPTSFVFQEIAVLDVLKKLEEVYGLEIKPSPALKDCYFTGDLNGLELYIQLDLVCQSINAKYEKQGTSIIVNGNSCR